MKIKLLILCCALLSVLGAAFAQSQNLQPIYTKIDRILEQKPEIRPILLVKLEQLSSKYERTSQNYLLLQEIVGYIEDTHGGKDVISSDSLGSMIGKKIPQGFGQLALEHLQSIEKTFHLHGTGPIWVIEFIDFQCPYCQKQHRNGILDTLEYKTFPGTVRTGVGMFPLGGSRHKLAQQAAESAECAYDQGGTEAFIKHKGALFAAGLQPTMTVIKRAAVDHGLDPVVLEQCVTNGNTKQRVQAQKQRGINLGVRGTPGSVIIDSRTGAFRMLSGAQGVERFESVVRELID